MVIGLGDILFYFYFCLFSKKIMSPTEHVRMGAQRYGDINMVDTMVETRLRTY